MPFSKEEEWDESITSIWCFPRFHAPPRTWKLREKRLTHGTKKGIKLRELTVSIDGTPISKRVCRAVNLGSLTNLLWTTTLTTNEAVFAEDKSTELVHFISNANCAQTSTATIARFYPYGEGVSHQFLPPSQILVMCALTPQMLVGCCHWNK